MSIQTLLHPNERKQYFEFDRPLEIYKKLKLSAGNKNINKCCCLTTKSINQSKIFTHFVVKNVGIIRCHKLVDCSRFSNAFHPQYKNVVAVYK